MTAATPAILAGKRIAILCTNGVELLELTEPRQALIDAGAETFLIAPSPGKIRSWNMTEWDREFDVDLPLAVAAHQDFDALHLPGGPLNADVLRGDDFAVFFIKEFFFKRNKPVSVLCHAPWLLAEADVLRGRKLTSFPVIKTDLMNAGAEWVNRSFVVDGNLVSGRSPADTPEFNPGYCQVEAILLFCTSIKTRLSTEANTVNLTTPFARRSIGGPQSRARKLSFGATEKARIVNVAPTPLLVFKAILLAPQVLKEISATNS